MTTIFDTVYDKSREPIMQKISNICDLGKK
jgi:hypothetical protein